LPSGALNRVLTASRIPTTPLTISPAFFMPPPRPESPPKIPLNSSEPTIEPERLNQTPPLRRSAGASTARWSTQSNGGRTQSFLAICVTRAGNIRRSTNHRDRNLQSGESGQGQTSEWLVTAFLEAQT
jgi:hypothetical protein